MGASLSAEYGRLLRAAGVMAWIFLYFLLQKNTHPGHHFGNFQAEVIWFSLWLVILVALWASTSGEHLAARLRPYLLAVQMLAAFCMRLEQPKVSVAFVLLIVTWQVMLFFPAWQALLWISIQFMVYFFIDTREHSLTWITFGSLVVYFLFKIFTCGLVVVAKREGDLRSQQATIIAELKAGQALLAESSRFAERMRISRELHDALGHGLTAMSLNLEVALNGTRPAEVEAHVRKAQAVAREMLNDVRRVVGSLREKTEIGDLRAKLVALTSDIPGLHIHVSCPDVLVLEQEESANAFLRCIQEIITNTLKHAEADNLWLSIVVEDGQLKMFARDDGKGEGKRNVEGTGLIGMRERFTALGGDIFTFPSAGRGFSIRLSLPTTSNSVSL
jgi:signal transduction histidine kinase